MPDETDLRRGYYLAVANFLRLYDEPVDLTGVDESDADVIRSCLLTGNAADAGSVRA